jgi:predicted CXXCH cytochrome family protein
MKRPILRPLLTLVLSTPAAALFAQQPVDHPRLVSVEAAQCGVCHDELIEGRSQVHPPAADDCTTCHEFSVGEGGTTVALMDSEPALCVFCHDDKEAAVEMELEAPHMPAADSCLTCHDPHASDHEHVLISPAAELCAECHDVGDLDQVHGGQLTEATRCATCHNPHGSDNERMLLASNLHPPFEEGSCQGCHRQPFGDRIRLRARGEKLCTACHGEFEVPAGGSEHAALQGERGRAGCLSCHDPHMSNERAILLIGGPQLCAECHADLVAKASAEDGHYPAGEDCLNCHGPHTAEQDHLLIEDRGELCATCHDLEPAPPAAPPAATEIAGVGQEGYGPAVVVAAATFDNGTPEPSLCSEPFPEGTWNGEIVICERGEVRRVLKSESVRAGGAGGIILANQPGGADDLPADAHPIPAVQIRAADYATVVAWLARTGDHRATFAAGKLALQPTAPPPSAEGDLVAAHLGADLGRLDCLGCHTPHGEGNAKLLARNLHPPVEDGCDTCHEGGHDELMEGGGSELCLFCHDDPSEGATVPHEALELASCTDCHNPHASAQEKLVKAPGAGPCADCHDEQVAGPDEVAHGVIDLVGCRACHEPHGSPREKLLRAAATSLCLSCHGPNAFRLGDEHTAVTLLGRFEVPGVAAQAISRLQLSANGQRNHPVTGHRVLGVPTDEEMKHLKVETTFSGELTCLTCHDPHKGRSSQLFRWEAESADQACLECHPK